jgi:hypothetical protein
MSGYMMGMAKCFGCGKPFWFNPHRVPSIIVDGEREPVCADCVERANPQRIANGLEPIVPLPDAYEPSEE